MNRIDRARFDAATFPLTVEVPTRFDDLDTQSHINNAAAVVILQEARVGLNRIAGFGGVMGSLRAMVAALHVEYAAELQHPAPVMVDIGILAIGRTSFTIAQIARQEGVRAIYAQVTMVVTDIDGPVPLPGALRAAYEKLRID